MNKKLVVIVSLVSLVMVAAALTWVILGSAKDASQINNQQSNTDIETALKEAESFRPEGMCTTVMTPARHQATGVTYTFTSGCIPAGWEKV